MSSLHTFANKVGSLPTYAIKTRAHRFHASAVGFTERKSSSVPSELFFSDPSLFAGSWSHPNSGFSSRVNDGKAPLGFQIQNFAIGNQLGAKWIDNFNDIISQNKFRSDPNKENDSAEDETKQKFEDCLRNISTNPEAVDSEKSYQDHGNTRPSEITARPESFIHSLSIAGDRK